MSRFFKLKPENIAFAVCLVICAWLLFPYVLPLVAAACAAFLMENFFCKVKIKFRFFKNRDFLLSVVLCLFFSAICIGPFFAFIAKSLTEALSFISEHQEEWLASKLFSMWPENLQAYLQKLGLQISLAELGEQFKSVLARLLKIGGAFLQNLLSQTPEGILLFLVFVFSWPVFLVHGKTWRTRFLVVVVPSEKVRNIVTTTTAEVVRAVVVSNIVVSAVQSVLVGLSLFIAQVPNAFLFVGLSFFASFVPLVGTAPIFIFSALFLYSQSKVGMALFLLVAMVAVGLVDNFLRPYLVKGGSNLSFFWLFLAFVSGVSAFGVLGVIAGPLLFSLFVKFYASMFTSPLAPSQMPLDVSEPHLEPMKK